LLTDLGHAGVVQFGGLGMVGAWSKPSSLDQSSFTVVVLLSRVVAIFEIPPAMAKI
jgi:hypothetical protein